MLGDDHTDPSRYLPHPAENRLKQFAGVDSTCSALQGLGALKIRRFIGNPRINGRGPPAIFS
jgi:hypothetical protein